MLPIVALTLLLTVQSSAGPCGNPAPGSPLADLQTATTAMAPSAGKTLPVPAGTRITSDYGWRIHPIKGTKKFHNGVDFGMSRGSEVLSPGDGEVVFAGWAGGYGRYVEVQLADGSKVAYAHLLDYNDLKTGSKVKAGDVVGHVNSSGSSTGDHLHLEVWDAKGEHQDPATWFGY